MKYKTKEFISKLICFPLYLFSDNVLLANCDAKYGGIDALLTDLQAYANAQIESSFDYLLMTAHFANFEAYRPGFHAMFLKLSDRAWGKGTDIIKFILQRGGKMNFNQPPRLKRNVRFTYYHSEILII